MTTWHTTKYRGVRFREHPERKKGVKFDRYFAIRYQKDGKRKEEGLGWWSEGMTAENAFAQLLELKKAHKKGIGPTRLSEKRAQKKKQRKMEEKKEAEEARAKITFGKFFDDTYYPIAKISKKLETHRKENEHFKNWLKPVLGDIPLKEIKPSDLEKVKKNLLEADRSPRTIEYVFASFRQVWNMAQRDKLVSAETPTKFVKKPKVNNGRVRYLTQSEATSLLENLEIRSQQLHDMSLLSLHTGMRFGEICSLKWGNIDIKRGLINVLDAKGDKDRTVYLTDELKKMFKGMDSGEYNDLVFKTREGGMLEQVSNAFSRAVDELKFNEGIEDRKNKITFYSLRHTFASWHIEAGTDIYRLKNLMGHSDIKMTERYAHVNDKLLQDATQNFMKRIKKKK